MTAAIDDSNAVYKEQSADNNFVDVKIGLSNVEGATQVVIEQLDEGEILPFEYDVAEFNLNEDNLIVMSRNMSDMRM